MNRSIAILLLGLSLTGCVEARSVVPADGPGPLLVAHRAGTADYPENTLLAIRKALDNGADALWLSVQLSADGHPVLYRPADLAVLTQGAGAVGQSSLAELARLNAGYMFKAEDGSYPYRQKPLRIPTLRQALRAIPPQVPVFLDMKSLPVEPLVDAVAGELERQKAWSRVRFYSTEKAANDYLTQRYADRARQFESRDATRNRLVGLAFGERCEAPPAGGTWMGIELRRELTVTERFTLGESSYKVPAGAVVDAQSDGLRAPRAGEGGDVRHRDRRGLPHRARPGRRRGDEQLAQEDGGDPPPGARRSARRVARQRPFHRFAQGLGLFAGGVAGVELGAVAPHRLTAAGVVQLDADHR
ncbi:glycerolphosphodiesterase [Pseudomonas aeruginosa]|nr:glycerolphosphodiesterase [Pseudomonas aeruginosa]